MSVQTAMSLYLLTQNTLLILSPALVLILKIASNYEPILDCIPKMSEDVLPIKLSNVFKIIFLLCAFFPQLRPLPLPVLLSTFQSSSPHADNGAISSHLPCIFRSLSVLLIVKEYRSEFVILRGLTPSRQGIP